MDIQIPDSKPNLLSLSTPEAGGLIGSATEIDASSYVLPVPSLDLISNKDVLLSFDDITEELTAPVPDSYGGLNWTDAFVIDKDYWPDSGYNKGNVSPPYSAWSYLPVTIEAPENSENFTFQGYFASAWDESLNISVTGLDDGYQKYKNTINVNDQEAKLFEFDTPIDTVKIESLGNQFVLDDFSYEFLSKEPGSISGYKWEDLNGNSKWDEKDGEKGLQDWTIYIDENKNGQLDSGEPSTLTNSSGYYEFVDLQPATYHIGELIKEGWKQTYPDLVEPETENSLRSQSSFLNVDDESPEEFSRDKRRPIVEEPDYVEGQVVVQWVDDYDPMEVNAFNLEAGAEILRHNVDPNQDLSNKTVSGGRLNAEKVLGSLGVPGTHTVELKSGESKTDINFGNQEIIPGSISGSKWKDLNGNGEWDEGEEGLKGWTIYIDENKNGKLDEGEKYDITDKNGDYKLSDIDAGTYHLGEVIKDGWEQTSPGTSPQVEFEADFSDDGSGDLDGFTIDNTGGTNDGLWHLSTRRGNEEGHSAQDSMYYGDETSGNYDEGHTAGRITSKVIDLNGLDDPQLSFNYFLETEGSPSSFDQAKVMVSKDGGNSFQEIASNDGELTDPTTGWTSATFGLDDYSNEEIQIRFDFDTVDSIANQYEGWFVDDVIVGTAGGPLYHTVEVGNGQDVEDIDFGNKELAPPFEIIEDKGSASFAIDTEDSTYWIINNKTDEKYQLLDKDNNTYTHDSNKNWDGAAVEYHKKKDGYNFLIDGSNKKDKKAQVWNTDSNGVILDDDYKWSSGKKLYKLEKKFKHDLNDDGVIGKPKKKKSIEALPTTEDYMLTESNEVLPTMEYDVLPESDPLIDIISGQDFF